MSSILNIGLSFSLWLCFVFGASSKGALAQAKQPPQRLPSAREVANRTLPSVVLLLAQGTTEKLGSGFFFEPDLVATNFHVIKGASKIYLRIVGQKDFFKVEVVGLDKENDIAVLRVFGGTNKALSLGVNSKPAIGDVVYAVGNPEGLEGTFSNGIISSIRNNGDIQITAPISPGSSGGPVLNQQGKVIGIATYSYVDGQNLNFAILIEHLSSLVKTLRSGDKDGGSGKIVANVEKTRDELIAAGERYANQGKHESAIQFYKQALEVDSSSAPAYFKMGQSYMSLSMNSEAFSSFRKAVNLAPDNPTYHFTLGFHYAYHGADTAAIEECKKLGVLGSALYSTLRLAICANFSSTQVKEFCSKAK